MSYSEPCPTLTASPTQNMSLLFRPVEGRPLSIRECEGVQGFPDTWKFKGSVGAQYCLAEESHLGESTIRNFEAGRAVPSHNTLAGIRTALEAAGVVFVEPNGLGVGVRLRERS